MLFEGHRSDDQFHWLMLFINFFNDALTFIDILKYSFVMSTACLYAKKKINAIEANPPQVRELLFCSNNLAFYQTLQYIIFFSSAEG